MNKGIVSIIVLFTTIAVACSNPVREDTEVEKDLKQHNVSSETDSLTFYLAEPKQPDKTADTVKNKSKNTKRRKLNENEFYLGPVPQ